jgi:hypothetical protein
MIITSPTTTAGKTKKKLTKPTTTAGKTRTKKN